MALRLPHGDAPRPSRQPRDVIRPATKSVKARTEELQHKDRIIGALTELSPSYNQPQSRQTLAEVPEGSGCDPALVPKSPQHRPLR